jgi:sulfite reductase (NADPH) hemoprotein beta-component
MEVYQAEKTENEKFLDTYRRVGLEPFKDKVYAKAD